MAGGIKTKYKIIGGVAVGALILGMGQLALKAGLIPSITSMVSKVPEKVDIATLGNINTVPAQSYTLPAAPQAGAPTRKFLVLPWQANGSLILANGGPHVTPDSLMTKYAGGGFDIEVQNDYGKMQEQLLKFASGLSNNNPNPDGAAYVSIMGDGGPAFFAGVAPQMAKLGQKLEIVGITGFSHGEDKCMAPDNGGDPQKSRGIVVAAVPRDGDWNICVKWASDNGIPINTDNSIYDPTAINFMDTDSFSIADDKFTTKACDTRDEAKAGIKTGKKVPACVNAVATWTPGDVTVMNSAHARELKLITLASTKDYDQQMPGVIIGIKSEMEKNRTFVVGTLRAIDRASVDIRTSQDGVMRMATAEAKIFGTAGGDEATPAYWARYFNGLQSPDGRVTLGGSRVSTLAEVRDYLGMGTGTLNVFNGVWGVFGKYDVEFFPTIVKATDIPKYEDVVDTSFITAALEGVTMGAPTTTAFSDPSKVITHTVSSKALSGDHAIQFATGTATISPKSRTILADIANQSGMTNLLIRIDGHTDSSGNPDSNVDLSRRRAQAVADALTHMAPNTFPKNRMEVNGYGDTKPVGDNATEEGRAQNRRVVITLGTSQ